jgi:hypothetical protein
VKEFKEAHGHLTTSELAAEMRTFITMKRSTKASSSKGSKGRGMPLSVLRHTGYSEEELDNIEKTADKEWDSVLGSYVYFVDIRTRGLTEEQSVTKESVVEGSPQQQKRKLKKAGTGTGSPEIGGSKKQKKDSSSDDKAEAEGDTTKDKDKTKKKKKPSNSKSLKLSVAGKLAKQKREAKMIVGSIAPVLAQLANVSQKVILPATKADAKRKRLLITAIIRTCIVRLACVVVV